MAARSWVLITGEYPPQRGGVADYCQILARGLVKAGDEVVVWVPKSEDSRPLDPGIRCRELPDHFGSESLVQLEAELRLLPKEAVIVVQYVPQAFGRRGMNLAFCRSMARLGSKSLWTMFHEVAMPLSWRQPLQHTAMAVVQRLMAAQLVRASQQIFVSIPAWKAVLKPLGGGERPQWLPVPSNLPCEASVAAAAGLRQRLGLLEGDALVGHFGTYGALIKPYLASVLPSVLASSPRTHAVLIGYGATDFAASLRALAPASATRIHALPGLSGAEVATALRASDVLFQPYPDGASCRRGSLMAGLSLGRPIVTTVGPLSESLWIESAALVQVPCDKPDAMRAALLNLLPDAQERQRLGQSAELVYQEHFALEHLVRKLRAA